MNLVPFFVTIHEKTLAKYGKVIKLPASKVFSDK